MNIGSDVWIATRVTILDKVNVGDGSIVAAGAVVTKDIPSYAVVGGVPAKVIKYRYPQNTIDALLQIRWWDWEVDKIKKNLVLFHDVDQFVLCHDVLAQPNLNTDRLL